MWRKLLLVTMLSGIFQPNASAQNRARELGVNIGILPTGDQNAITDVDGVSVGQVSLIEGEEIRTGLTVILPHSGNVFQEKVPAAVSVGNGFGKLAGSTQVKELGNIETPIVLTNTLNVGLMIDAVVQYTLAHPENHQVRSVNAVVGETNDGYLNNIRKSSLNKSHFYTAIENARSDKVLEGNVGAGTGTVCFGFKGGIGTSSRVLPKAFGNYTVGVLVQSNFGGVLSINGAPVGKELKKHYLSDQLKGNADGSCMIVIATDAPLNARNLQRLAYRALWGLARTGGSGSNGSGDYAIAFSTHPEVRVRYGDLDMRRLPELPNAAVSPLFLAVIEATEEAIVNSLFMAETMRGFNGHEVEALSIEKIMPILEKYGAVEK